MSLSKTPAEPPERRVMLRKINKSPSRYDFRPRQKK